MVTGIIKNLFSLNHKLISTFGLNTTTNKLLGKVVLSTLLVFCSNVNAQNKDSLLRVGFDLQVEGKYEEAVRIYDTLLKIWLNDPNVLYQKALCLMRLSMPEEALGLFQKIIVLRPEFVGGYYGVSTAYVALQRWEEAFEYIEKTLALETNNAEYFLLRGRILVGLNKVKDACKDFKKAKTMGSYDAPFLIRTYCK